MVDKVDIEAFRKLKSSSPHRSEPSPIKVETPILKIESSEVSPRRNLDATNDPILKTWNDTVNTPSESEKEIIPRKAPISFRLPENYIKQLDDLPGRGVGSKVRYVLNYFSRSRKVFKDQVAPLISLLSQIDREITQYTAAISSISELRGPDGSKIYQLAKQVSLIHQFISYSKEFHSEHMTPAQLKTLDFALGLSRNQNS